MKFTTTSAVSALLLASTVSAAPVTDAQRAVAERRAARRAARAAQPFPLAVNYTSYGDRVNLAKPSGDKFTQYDSNWAGAVLSSSGVTTVAAVVNAPAVSTPPGGSSGTQYGGAAWVGIDGASSNCDTILQTGFQWLVQDGQASYSAWYEWYPQQPYYWDLAISEGDQISMSVVATSATSGTAYITNESTGQSVSQPLSNQQALCQATAEWIVEDFGTGNGLEPFAAFDPVTFSNAGWGANGASATAGVSGAGIVDIEQNGQVLTNCGTSGSSTVQCSYTG